MPNATLWVSVVGCLALIPLPRAFAGSDVPSTYTAATDLAIHPKPPLPSLGPAGTIFNDPTFGSRMLRVTDPETQANAIGTSFLGPSGSFVHNWNADTTMFWVYGKGGLIPYQFDAASMKATRVPDPASPSGGLMLPFTGPFSYQKPNIIYGNRGVQIVEYDFNTRQSHVVFDGAIPVPGASGASYAPFVSDDDSVLCMAFGGIQDTYQYVVVLNRTMNKYSVLDTKNSVVDGHGTAVPLGFGIHTAYLDRTGRYVIIGKGLGNQGNSQWVVWDVQTGVVCEILAHWSGHDAAGFGVRVNESGYVGGDPMIYEQIDYSLRPLDPARINESQLLIQPNGLPTPHIPDTNGHFSWNNAQPDRMVPIVGTHYRDAHDAAQPWRAWDDEIIAVATDGSSQVWRFAHHRSLYDGTNFYDSPRGNVSQDGRWFLFNSNWERTLGEEPLGGGARRDIFLVELAAGAQPSASGTPPSTPAGGGVPNPPSADIPGNLLADGGFEGGGMAWTGANRPGDALVTIEHHSGQLALQLTPDSEDRSTYQEVPVSADVQYDFGAWAKTDQAVGRGAGVLVAWLDATGSVIRRDSLGVLVGTHDWMPLDKTLTPPAGAVKARMRPYDAGGSGHAWFDDLSMRAVQ